MTTGEQQWYVKVADEAPIGPVTSEQVASWLEAGTVPATAQVNEVGKSEWVDVGSVDPFRSVSTKAKSAERSASTPSYVEIMIALTPAIVGILTALTIVEVVIDALERGAVDAALQSSGITLAWEKVTLWPPAQWRMLFWSYLLIATMPWVLSVKKQQQLPVGVRVVLLSTLMALLLGWHRNSSIAATPHFHYFLLTFFLLSALRASHVHRWVTFPLLAAVLAQTLGDKSLFPDAINKTNLTLDASLVAGTFGILKSAVQFGAGTVLVAMVERRFGSASGTGGRDRYSPGFP